MPPLVFIFCSSAVAIFTVIAMASQVGRSYRAKTGQGFSLLYLFGATWSSIAWSSYGMLRSQHLQVFTNIPWVVVHGLVLYYLWREDALTGRRACKAVLIMIAVTASLAFLDWRLLGILCACLSLSFRLPQLYQCWKSPGGKGISIQGQGASAAIAVCWITIGVGYSDGFVVVTSGYALLTSLYIGGSTHVGRKRRDRSEVSMREAYAA